MGEQTSRFNFLRGGRSAPAHSNDGEKSIVPSSADAGAVAGAAAAGLEKVLAVPVDRRRFFSTSATLAASAAVPTQQSTSKAGLLDRLMGSNLRNKIPFGKRTRSVSSIQVIPGIGPLLQNILGAEDSLSSLYALSNDVLKGTTGNVLPSLLRQNYTRFLDAFGENAAGISEETQMTFAHTLATAEDIQSQIDAWGVIMKSPNKDQRDVAQTQYHRMCDELDICLAELGIDQKAWKRLGRNDFGTRVLEALFREGKDGLAPTIEKEEGETSLKIMRNLANGAMRFSDPKQEPKAAAAFFKRAPEIMDSVPVDLHINGKSAHAIVGEASNTFFHGHPDLRPKDWKPREIRSPNTDASAKDAPRDLSCAHDTLEMNDPEMGPWLRRALVIQEQKQQREEEKNAVGAATGRG